MFKPLLPLLVGLVCSFGVLAQDVELAADHPDRYVVQRGDTLWDIAERFLRSPWLWPEIWQVNPQIDNPHLIYPGDEINLVYIDGQPRLQLERAGRPTLRLSPNARATPLRDAIDPIDLKSIRPFLDKRTVLDGEELAGLPYVLGIEEEALAGTEGRNIYVRDLDAQVGDSYAVVRPTLEFLELPGNYPWDKSAESVPISRDWSYPGGKSISDYVGVFWRSYLNRGYHEKVVSLGYEVVQTGTAEVIANGDPSTLLLTSSTLEVLPGDLVIPLFTADYDLEYIPHGVTEVPQNARVIALSKALFGSGRNQVVAINKGWGDGIENGHVLAAFREGEIVRDTIKYPKDDVKTFFSGDRRKKAKVKMPLWCSKPTKKSAML